MPIVTTKNIDDIKFKKMLFNRAKVHKEQLIERDKRIAGERKQIEDRLKKQKQIEDKLKEQKNNEQVTIKQTNEIVQEIQKEEIKQEITQIQIEDLRKEVIKKTNEAKFKYKEFWKGKTYGTKRPVHEVLSKGMWKGKRCFIIGGGPSLREYDFNELNNVLKDEMTIGINWVFKWFSNIKINISSDMWLYDRVKDRDDYKNFKGIKLWVDSINRPLNDCYYIRNIGRAGLPHSFEEGIYTHSNTGYSAVQVAYLLQADPIYLLGFDCIADKEGNTHWHGIATTPRFQSAWDAFMKGWKNFNINLKKRRTVINLSPISRIDYFPKQNFFDAFKINYNAILENRIKFNNYLIEMFLNKNNLNKAMHCYISDEELKEFGMNIIEFNNYLNANESEFMHDKIFIRRAS